MSAVENGTPSTRISISEDKLRAALAELKVEIVEEFSTKASEEFAQILAKRIAALELWRAAQDAVALTKTTASARMLTVVGAAGSIVGALTALVARGWIG